MNVNLNLKSLVGNGYDEFIECKKRYLVCKGSRGSKKSCTTALRFIYMMMMYYYKYNLKPNILVIRRYQNTQWTSTRNQLIWAMNRMGVQSLWKIPKADYTLTFKPSGQSIIFRGLDDAQSLTSITVSEGYLCWVWIEEAFQVTNEDDFNKIDMSIRGKLPEQLFHQFVITFNPWSDKSWLKRRFFDSPDEDTLSMTTTYRVNEFLSDEDRRIFENMKLKNPKRFRIEGDGEWGVSEGLIFENWEIKQFSIEEILSKNDRVKTKRGIPAIVSCHGMDFGYNDPTAFVGAWADRVNYIIYIWYEFCETCMENRKIANRLIADGYGNATIRADSEDPRTINELRLMGVTGIIGAKKGSGSVLGGIQKLQDYRIIIHPRCTSTIEAFENYAWKKSPKTNRITNEPEHEFSHIPDALRYGCEDLQKFGIIV